MKVATGRIGEFINTTPTHIRGVLLYGPDRGIAKEYQKLFVKNIVPDQSDSFLVTTLLGENIKNNPEQIAFEASQSSLLSGRRVVVVTDADDKSSNGVEAFLTTDVDTFLVIQAGDLKPTSRLRKLFENDNTLGAIACYQDTARAIENMVKDTMQRANITIEYDAFNWAISNMGMDRASTRSEIEKLVLYAGDTGILTLDDVRACMVDSTVHAIDDVIYACAMGNIPALDSALDISLDEGVSVIAILRMLTMHLLRLHRGKLDMKAGKRTQDIARGIFFKRQNAFITQLQGWSENGLVRALHVVFDAEKQCKKTNVPDFSVVSRALYSVAYLTKYK